VRAWSAAGEDSEATAEVLAAFSAATIDSGRLLGRSGDCEFGRLCHDSGEALAGGRLVEGDVKLACFDSGSKVKGESFSLEGEVE
jgi:hypothetical protein